MMEKILINSPARSTVNRVHGAIFCSIFNNIKIMLHENNSERG